MDANRQRGTKRKCTDSVESSKQRQQVCIIHCPGAKHGPFTNLCNSNDPNERMNMLRSIRDRRLSQPPDSPFRMEEACNLIPEDISDVHGYHRDCYQLFTKNLNRLSETSFDATKPSTSRPPRSSLDKVIFKPDCIFCKKEGLKSIKVKSSWTTESTSMFDFGGWQNVVDVAERVGDEDLLLRIRGVDLFAAEARYHKSCRKKYVANQEPDKWRSSKYDKVAKQRTMAEAHKKAFASICTFVDDEILGRCKVLRLSDLCEKYKDELKDTPFANPKYRAGKLKSKFEKHEVYKGKLSFCKVSAKGKFESFLVYSTGMSLDKAIQSTHELHSVDAITDVALFLRRIITSAFEESKDIPWPSTAEALAGIDDNIPTELENFLNHLLSGNPSCPSQRVTRLVRSLGQDICRAATNGKWKMSKHILVCMTLRHLFRSAQLITLMNRLGHSESYSFSLELETAIAQALQQTSSILSRQVVRHPVEPSVFHSDFDNFDQYISSLTGSGSIHTAHGIMLQEISNNETVESSNSTIPSVARTKERSLAIEHEGPLPSCYVNRKANPDFRVQHWKHDAGYEAFKQCARNNVAWMLGRKSSGETGQELPGWAGFVSVTGVVPSNLTTIDYYPVINYPITEFDTVQECLRAAEEASREVGQDYVITTFDLGVCMKAYPLIWSHPEKYKKHIVLIGTFHVICAYTKMLGKKMVGSGLEDILLEAGLMSSGSMKGVMTGKNYDRSLHCHKTMVECLERLLFDEFLSMAGKDDALSGIPDESKNLFQELIRSPTKERLAEVVANADLKALIESYESFKADVRNGSLGKTAQFWMSYVDCVWIALSLIRSVKENNFPLYLHCLFLMPDLFFTFGGHNYSRYLTYLAVFLANIEDSHPGALTLLEGGAISVARSLIPGNRCAVDKTIEETIMKHGKSRGGGGSGVGLSGIMENYSAYKRWARTSTERARFLTATLSLADMTFDSHRGNKHRDQQPTQIRKGEGCVKKAIDAVKSFLNPCDVDDKNGLYVLSSGARVPAEVEKDVMHAITTGKDQKEMFIKERLEKKTSFSDPIKNLKLKTMAETKKRVKLKTSQRKVIEYKQQGDIAFQLMVKAQNSGSQLDLREIMKYSLTPVPYSIGTSDNFFAKTDKAKGLHYLLKDVENSQPPPTDKTLVVEDGNAVFYYLKEMPANFHDICIKIHNVVSSNCDVIFSTDMYKPDSVKSSERTRRGCAEKRMITGGKTKRPPDWKQFLTNDENKKQLIQVILDVWSEQDMAKRLYGKKMIFIKEGEAQMLTSQNGRETLRSEIPSLNSTQEETDSRVILYCQYGKEQGYDHVQIKSPDTDIFFILLHYAHLIPDITLLFHTGRGNKQRLIDVTYFAKQSSPEYCTALLGLHAFSGCDSTSAFKGIGKVKPIKLLQQRNKFVKPLAELGDSWTVPEELMSNLEEFTCALYGKPRFTDVDEARFALMKEKCKSDGEKISKSVHVDLSSFPPCKDSLQQHIRRVNYQVAIWKRAHEPKPIVPPPTDGHGWTKNVDKLEPLWSTRDVLPPRLVDVLDCMGDDDSSDDDYDSDHDDQYYDSDQDTDSEDEV